MGDLSQKLAGRFIVLDGPDGAGKSTQAALLASWLCDQGVRTVLAVDPGGTAIGRRIRQILLDPAAVEMGITCEMLLYMASRAQLVHEIIRPGLSAGACVLCDRYISSTIAYQGAGGADISAIGAIGDLAVGHAWPDLTIILDVDPQQGLARVDRELDRIEAKGLEYHRRVREIFLRQAAADPVHFTVIDGSGQPLAVAQSLREVLAGWSFTHTHTH
jgi:dTMP kinase